MDRGQVLRWVEGYEQGWRAGDIQAVERLFAPDAHYLRSPYSEPEVGLDAIRAMWREDDGETFTFAAEVVAVEGSDAVVRARVGYGVPLRQEYRDLWVLHFADAEHVDHFEEWAYWPGRPYTADE